MITQEVRTAEKEIDLFIANLPVWNTKRQVLLTKLMTIWRDGLELLALQPLMRSRSIFRTVLKRASLKSINSRPASYALIDALERITKHRWVDALLTGSLAYS